MTDKPNGDPTQDEPTEPETEPPTGLTADVFDLAALINTVKITFKFKEETALNTVNLALNYRITKEQMALSTLPPPQSLHSLPSDEPEPKAE